MARTHIFKGSCVNGFGYYAYIEDGELVVGEHWPREGGETFRGAYADATRVLRTLEKEAVALYNAITAYYAEQPACEYKYVEGDEVTLYSNQVKIVLARVNHNGPCYRFRNDPNLYCESSIKGRTKDLVPKLAIKKEDCASWEYSEVDPVFVCSNCSWVALEHKGRSIASKFCPHCGKYMINHETEE